MLFGADDGLQVCYLSRDVHIGICRILTVTLVLIALPLPVGQQLFGLILALFVLDELGEDGRHLIFGAVNQQRQI